MALFTNYRCVYYIVSFLNISNESFQQTYSIGQSHNKCSIGMLVNTIEIQYSNSAMLVSTMQQKSQSDNVSIIIADRDR